MCRQPPISTSTDSLFPYSTLFRSFDGCLHPGPWRVGGSAVCYVYPCWDDGRPKCFMVYQSEQRAHFAWLDPATGDQWLVSEVRSDEHTSELQSLMRI